MKEKEVFDQIIAARMIDSTPNPAISKTYTGNISIQDPSGEDEEILFVGDSEDPIAEIIQRDIKKHGSCLTVRYWVSDEPLSKDELTEEFLSKVMGLSAAKYDVQYSEATGYLWTDEKLNVGGHDLLAELKSYEGYCLHMEIDYEF